MDCGEQTVGVRLAQLIAFEDARHGGGPTTRGKKCLISNMITAL